MRVRKQHAWSVALLVLFVLPVLKPQGIPALERPVGAFFAFFGRIPALNPALWGRGGDDDADSPRVRALEAEVASLREGYAVHVQRLEEQGALADALHETPLDRMPTALRARVLRTRDPSSYRRSLLIDRGAVDGLDHGHAVVSGGTFLGRVETVRGHSARVKLFTDPRSRTEVGFRTDRGHRLTGYVRGSSLTDEVLDVRHVVLPDGAGRVPVGTAVFTSNADPLVPAGLLVGYVVAVSDKEGDRLLALEIRPAYDLDRATSALVLLPRQP